MSATGALRPAAEGSCAAEQERIDITAEVAQAEVVVAEPVSPGDVSVEGGYRKVRSGAPVSWARTLAGCPNNTIGRSKKMVSACQPGRPVQWPCMLLLCVPHPLARFALVRRLAAEGMSHEAIAAQVSLTHQQIDAYLSLSGMD
jgi:hypothetical protein